MSATQELRSATSTSNSKAAAPGGSSNSRGLSAERDDELVREVREILRERLEGREEPDPRGTVDAVLREFLVGKRLDFLVQAAREGLIQWSWDFVRHNPLNNPQSARSRPISGKWDDVAAAARERRDIFEVTVWIGGAQKFLGDCTKADLELAAELREKQATTMVDNADRLRKLGRKLKAGQVVRDLDRAVVEGVFNA